MTLDQKIRLGIFCVSVGHFSYFMSWPSALVVLICATLYFFSGLEFRGSGIESSHVTDDVRDLSDRLSVLETQIGFMRDQRRN